MTRALLPVLALALACGGTSRRIITPPPHGGPPKTVVTKGLPATGLDHPRAMRIHLIDVGQGAATLLEFPCAAVLIDTGGEDDEDFHSNLALVLYLKDFFARRPDLEGKLAALYLTHPHIDHTRGAEIVYHTYQVQNVVTDGLIDSSGGAEQQWLQDQARAAKRPAFVAQVRDIPAGGITNPVIDPVRCAEIDPRLTVLWGQVQRSDVTWEKEQLDNANNHSVVVRVDLGEASLLITGDLEEAAIKSLIDLHGKSGALDVDVYQVGHHGSYNGTTDPLLAAITPDLALIAAGNKSVEQDWTAWRYGHPRKVTIDKLMKQVTGWRPKTLVDVARGTRDFVQVIMWRAIFCTAWDGSVVVEMHDDGSERVWVER